MRAGFASVDITPPLGTRMSGFGGRDKAQGCVEIHDPLSVRAVYCSDGNESVLLVGYDVLFFPRSLADRIKGAIGREIDLLPRQILLNTSHTHVGPSVGSWAFEHYHRLPAPLYVDHVVNATAAAAAAAVATAADAIARVGETTTCLPVSRRFPGATGIEWRPYPDGETYDRVPFVLLESSDGNPVALVFSVSCHPSTTGGHAISADYPGIARNYLAEFLGCDCAMFLQGCGGDTKACVIADGAPDDTGRASWRSGSWDDIDRAGRIVAEPIIASIHGGDLQQVCPHLRSGLTDMHWPLCRPPTRKALEREAEDGPELRQHWARRMLGLLDRTGTLPAHAPVLLQVLQLADGLRVVALEGEAVAGIAHLLTGLYDSGVTMPLGYANGQGLYLPTERMLPEGGYEVVSAYEYGFPAPLTAGYEKIVVNAVRQLQAGGVG